MSIVCKIIGHERDPLRVWEDGLSLRSKCRRCAVAMLKDDGKNAWRLFNQIDDFDLKRRKTRRSIDTAMP